MQNKPKCVSCANQVKRFVAKPFFETLGPDGGIELANILHRYGHDRAEIIVDEAMIRNWGENETDRVPSPSQIWGLCKEDPQDFKSLEQKKSPVKGPEDCPECYGTGWRVIELQDQTSGVERCPNLCTVPGEKAVFDTSKSSRDDAGYDTWRSALVAEIQSKVEARKVAVKRRPPPALRKPPVTEADFKAIEKKA